MQLKKINIVPTVLTILGISFIIFFHELGHYTACKLFGVPTPVFSIGFGPALAQYKTRDTTFQIAMLPLGGYVSIDSNTLMQKPYWQQLIICLAGIFNNLLLATVIIILIFISTRSRISTFVKEVFPGSPAQKADIQEGDQIIAYNNHPLENDIQPLFNLISKSHNQPIDLNIKRNDTFFNVTCIPEILTEGDAPKLGFSLEQVNTQISSRESLHDGIHFIGILFKSAGGLIPSRKEGNNSKIVGPLGILAISKDALARGWHLFLLWIALISAQVGFFNLLPLPFLDGGQVVQLTGRAVAGRALSPFEMSLLHYAIIALLITLFFMFNRKKK